MKKIIWLFFTLLLVSSCGENMETENFFVGTYTDGESQGIYRFEINEDGKIYKDKLMCITDNPSFLTLSSDNKYLVAVNEISDSNGEGRVESYLVKNDSLLLINSQSSGGAHPCHISTGINGYLLVSNYSGGNVGLLKINKDGELYELLDLSTHQGKGKHPRQDKPHAHQAKFLSNNKTVEVDLGTNSLWFNTINSETDKFIRDLQSEIKMPEEVGPRHLAIHPNQKWIYVINELNSAITHLEAKDSSYEVGFSVITVDEKFDGENFCADIHISSDGRFLYGSNRGENSIVVFEINNENGSLKKIQTISCGGDWPRNFTFNSDEKFLLVANQKSNNIVSFTRDEKFGKLKFCDSVKAPTPVCLRF